jgi:mono/diheme cytochrome c family protein
MKSPLMRLRRPLLIAAAALAAGTTTAAPDKKPGNDPSMVERGRYLVQVAGCNDCHTAGYAEKGGKVAEKDWLTGDVVGWRGPFGTTYPVNLRLYVEKMTEADWAQRVKTMETRPPMPWFNLRAMTDSDQRAIYRYLKAAGPAGQPAPAYLPPDKTPPAPYFQFPS